MGRGSERRGMEGERQKRQPAYLVEISQCITRNSPPSSYALKALANALNDAVLGSYNNVGDGFFTGYLFLFVCFALSRTAVLH